MDSSDSDVSSIRKFRCSIQNCNASFTKNHKLLSHIHRHTGERPFVCDEVGCEKTYTNNSHLRRHKKVNHGKNEAEMIMCDHEGCGIVLASKSLLKKHCNRKHNVAKYSFKCSECKQGFHRKRQLQQHLYLHTGEPGFSCDKCDMSFTTNRNLNKHKKSHRIYNCDCGESFHRWSLILAHKKICKKVEFICDICDKSFSHCGNLKNHKLTHINQSERPVFVCSYPNCERMYFYKRNLQYHVNNFHKHINENCSYKCTYPKCKVILKTKQSLKIHLQRHFQWTPKKKRQPRRDKGKPKKSMVSVLLDKAYQVEEDQENYDSVENIHTTGNQICYTKELTDDILLKQCDLALTLLGEKMVETN